MLDPFGKIFVLDSVLAAYVFSRSGKLIAAREERFNGVPSNLVKLGGFSRDLANAGNETSELILQYSHGMLFFRIIDGRVLVLVAGPRTVLSLLRMTVEVIEHEWRSRGVERLFPLKRERARWPWKRRPGRSE
jgi:hypothetical protein